MDIRVLGPVEIHGVGGEVLRLPRRKERLALSVLVLEPGRVVAVDRLVDLLWGNTPPSGARANLQSLMSRVRAAMRRAGGTDEQRIRAQGAGYSLEVGPDVVDLQRFHATVGQARTIEAPALRSARLSAALELWRGPALAGTALGAVREQLCADLEEARFSAVSERIDADLAAGRHAQLIPELSGLVAGHPLREQLHGQLMLALHRSGRRADALAAYQRARHVLVSELGLEPGRRLRQLEADILSDSADLDLTSDRRFTVAA